MKKKKKKATLKIWQKITTDNYCNIFIFVVIIQLLLCAGSVLSI